MGLRLGDRDGYPPGASAGHPHFWEPASPDACPDCGERVDDDVFCPHCDAVLDPDEAEAVARELDFDRQLDAAREERL